MKPKTILITLLLTASFSNGFSQKEWSNWYYNGTNLLTFKNGYAQIVKNFISAPTSTGNYNFSWFGTGGISYSDPVTGEMKFIISSRVGFNRNYDGFPSGIYLRSCPDDYSFHIIPFHNDPNKFYVIQFQGCAADLLQQSSGLQVRCPNAIGLAYSIVDLTLDGGLGDFSVANQGITSGLNGQITTVRHANGKDVWVIVHPFNSDKFNAFLVTDGGIQPAVESQVGPVVSGTWESALGMLTASHDGKLLAGISGMYSGKPNNIQLFDFNNATGVLSNYRTLPFDDYSTKLQFSPDNSKLYCSGYNAIYQYDLNSPDVPSTKTKVVDQPNGYMYDMQLAPDGKIYVTKTYTKGDIDQYGNPQEYTGVFECPNLAQFACNFNPHGLSSTQIAFPDLINDFITEPKEVPATKLNLGKDTAICFGELKITAPSGWESYRWNTGDTTQQITVKKPGTYYVLTGNTGFSCPEAYGYINVSDKAIKLNLGPDTTLCPKTPYLIHIDSSYTNVLWGNGSDVKDSVLRQSSTLIISANDQNGCFTDDTVSVYFSNYPSADFSGDTTLCNNQSLVLHLEPKQNPFGTGGVFLWQDGSQKDSFKISQPGLYWGQSTYQNCTIRDSIKVSYVNAANVYLGDDTTLCQGDSLQLHVNTPSANNTWSTGEMTSAIMVKDPGTYWVKVNNGSCTATDTINVSFQPKPSLFLGNDTSVCDKQKIMLQATTPNSTYLWQDNSTGQSFEVSSPGIYWLQVTRNGCSVRDSIGITYRPLPYVNLGNDTSICVNQSVTLHAEDPSVQSYFWQDNSQASSFLVTEGGLYFVNVKGINGCVNSDSITITTKPLPSFSLGKDTTLCETQSISLSVDLANTAYLWNTGNTGNSLLVSQPGTYWLEATQNGCSKRDSIRINYKQMPLVALGNDTTLCEGDSLLLDATNNGATYLWQDDSKKPVQMVTTAGLYDVEVNLNGCIKKDSVSVNYLYKPVFTLGNDTTLCTGQSITLKPSITNVSFVWQDGSIFPYYTVSDTGIYKLTATNICGSTTHQIIISKGLCELYLPNAFTPNGDGLNDLFRVKYPGFIKVFEMEVYNRFGQVIFKTTDPNVGWDGTYKGVDQPAGVYVWKIILTDLDNQKKFEKGILQLLR